MKLEIAGGIPRHLMEELQKDKPSDRPEYWAKSGCKHCMGRGVVGNVTREVGDGNRITNSMICVCVSRRWGKWQEEWMDNRGANNRDDSSSEKDQRSEEERFESVRPRLEKIDEAVHALKSEILGYEDRINSLTYHGELCKLDKLIVKEQETLDWMDKDIEDQLFEIDRIGQRAEGLARESKRLRRCVAQLGQRVEEDRAVQNEQAVKIKNLIGQKERVEQDLSRASHTMRKKCREAQRKLEKLERRRVRILHEIGLNSRIRQNST